MEENRLNQLYKLIANSAGVELEEITPESEFLADFNTTEAEVGELIKRIEERMGIELDFTNLRDIVSVKDLVDIVEEAEL
jgi:acyl carrier protein